MSLAPLPNAQPDCAPTIPDGNRAQRRWPTFSPFREALLALLFSLTGMLAFIGRAVYLLVTRVLPRTVEVETMRIAVLEMTTMATCALLLLPMFIFNLRALQGKDETRLMIIPPLRWRYALALGILWVFTLCLGSLVTLIPESGWMGTVPLLPLGVLLPLILLVWTGAGGLLAISRRRFWSVSGFAIAGSTALAMAGEYLLLALGRGIGELLWGKQPFWRGLIDQLGQQLEAATTPAEALDALTPYLSNPWVIGALFLFAACLVPLIEEASKVSLLFWLGPRLASAGEGFALGALCGAGFSLIEGMLATGAATSLWGVGILGRVSSSLMHVTVSALLGSAIAVAFRYRRRRQLVGTYLLSAGLHGLWNGTLIMAFYVALRIIALAPAVESNDMAAAIQVALGGLLILLALSLLFALFVSGAVALPVLNASLRRKSQIESADKTSPNVA